LFGAHIIVLALVAAGPVSPYTWPLDLPRIVTSSFGEYRGGRFHAGLDLRTGGIGKEEKAPLNGYVSRVRCSPSGYGKAVYLRLEDGNTAVFEMKDEEAADEEPKRQVVSIGENLPDFDAGLKGMKVDEEKSIKVSYPEDFATEELRGQTKTFAVKMIEIYDRQLPELNDEWVKTTFAPAPKEGEEPPADVVDTVDKLKGRIREAMEKSAQDIADRDVNDQIISKVIENSQIDFPEVMVAERVDERLHELQEELKNRKLNLEDYLKHVNKNLEELRNEFAEEAKQGLKVNLAIYEIVEKEEIKVEDADIDEEIKTMAESRNVPVETVRAYLDSTDGTATIKYRLLRKKVLDFLAGASNIKSVG
jgi:trigger factor